MYFSTNVYALDSVWVNINDSVASSFRNREDGKYVIKPIAFSEAAIVGAPVSLDTIPQSFQNDNDRIMSELHSVACAFLTGGYGYPNYRYKYATGECLAKLKKGMHFPDMGTEYGDEGMIIRATFNPIDARHGKFKVIGRDAHNTPLRSNLTFVIEDGQFMVSEATGLGYWPIP